VQSQETPGPNCGVENRDKIRRLEQRTNTYKSVKQMVINSKIKEEEMMFSPALLNGSQF
jgi:DNA-binding protein H-NS